MENHDHSAILLPVELCQFRFFLFPWEEKLLIFTCEHLASKRSICHKPRRYKLYSDNVMLHGLYYCCFQIKGRVIGSVFAHDVPKYSEDVPLPLLGMCGFAGLT